MNLKTFFSKRKENQTAEVPFFVFLTFTMTLIAAWTVYAQPRLREPGLMLLFLGMMALHIGLYWLIFFIDDKSPHMPVYLGVQAAVALLINLIGDNMALPLGLYMGLIGLTVGVYKLSIKAVLFIGLYLVLSLYSFSRVVGWESAGWWLMGVIPTMIFVIIYVSLYNRQAEARGRAQHLAGELEAANRQLSEYAAQVEALTLSTERQRMARELHDTLSQGLAGLILQLEAVDAHLSANRTERARAIVQQAMSQARATLAGARRAIDDLRQAPADLLEAVEQEARRFTQATGIPCPVEADLKEPVPPALCEPVQRAVAEALTNVARHASASRAQVRVSGSTDNGLVITVEDDGAGFDPQSAFGQPGHYGLLGIRERARLAGGAFEIESLPGRGAKLVLRLPYPSVENEPARSQP